MNKVFYMYIFKEVISSISINEKYVGNVFVYIYCDLVELV